MVLAVPPSEFSNTTLICLSAVASQLRCQGQAASGKGMLPLQRALARSWQRALARTRLNRFPRLGAAARARGGSEGTPQGEELTQADRARSNEGGGRKQHHEHNLHTARLRAFRQRAFGSADACCQALAIKGPRLATALAIPRY